MNDKNEIASILREIVKEYGKEILYDSRRANALLMDFIPDNDKERKLIVTAIKEKIGEHIIEKIDIEERDVLIKYYSHELLSSVYITKEAADFAVQSLVFAIDTESEVSFIEDRNDNNNTDSHIEKLLTKGNNNSQKTDSDIELELQQYSGIGYKGLAFTKQIREIKIPDNIKYIYGKAFYNCTNLERISMPITLEKIGALAFEGCRQLSVIEIERNNYYCVTNGILIDKQCRKAIRAVNDTKDVVTIPQGTRSISRKCFEDSLVKEIKIPSTIQSIENDFLFACMELNKIEVDNKNKAYRSIRGVLHSKRGDKLIRYPQGRKDVAYYIEDAVAEIEKKAFSSNPYLKTVTFNSCLSRISDQAFEFCNELETLMIPISVKEIGDFAFQYCGKLKSIILSRSIKKIGDGAFYQCDSLENISLPQNIERIGNFAFSGCSKIKKVIISSNVSFIGDGAFIGCKDMVVHIMKNSYVERYCQSHGIRYELI